MKIEFHYTYIIMAFSFVLAGYFTNLLIFTSILIIHELGHYLVAKYLQMNPVKIVIYPFGGITKLNNYLNTNINKELLVAISGVINQSIYYIIILLLYQNNIIREYIFNLFKNYHYSILFFNLLPIHPLDGSKILSLFLMKILPYKLTMKINIFISVIVSLLILLLNYYNFNYTSILIIGVIITSIIKYYKSISYRFNRFLLERYLYKFNFDKTIKINNLNKMYRDKYHVIKNDDRYVTEKQLLFYRFREKL